MQRLVMPALSWLTHAFGALNPRGRHPYGPSGFSVGRTRNNGVYRLLAKGNLEYDGATVAERNLRHNSGRGLDGSDHRDAADTARHRAACSCLPHDS